MTQHISEPVSHDVDQLLKSYKFAQTTARNLESECLRESQGSGKNTVKNLRHCIRNTPFASFQRAQMVLLDAVAARVKANDTSSRSSLALSVATLAHGILVSGGCRRNEICHLREGEQTSLSLASREVHLRAVDRKNKRAHEFLLRERWLPTWFVAHYMSCVRPTLLAKAQLPPGLPETFLLLQPLSGRPFGCVEEAADGTGRNQRALEHRMAGLSKLWVKHVSMAFREAGLTLPSGQQQFSMHVVRNVGGHAVFIHRGLEAAAHFLGDRIGTIEGTYAALKGEMVDTSLLD
ncbi:MAG: hypothetical protein ACYC7F_02360 [Gemmatimonadaceae bacterium]